MACLPDIHASVMCSLLTANLIFIRLTIRCLCYWFPDVFVATLAVDHMNLLLTHKSPCLTLRVLISCQSCSFYMITHSLQLCTLHYACYWPASYRFSGQLFLAHKNFRNLAKMGVIREFWFHKVGEDEKFSMAVQGSTFLKMGDI